MLRKYPLFRHFPRLFGIKEENYHIVDPKVRGDYPALAEDFDTLDKEIMPFFWELDHEAKKAQNQFRRDQLLLIAGTALATILGAVQSALPGRKWPGFVETVLAASMAFIILKLRTQKIHESYFTNRLTAERLRGEYFLFLGRSEPYSNDADRLSHLTSRVAAIRTEEVK